MNDYNLPTAKSTAIHFSSTAHKRHSTPALEHVVAKTNVSSPISECASLPYNNPVIPPINAYGTFDPSRLYGRRPGDRSSSQSSSSSDDDHRPLLASNQPPMDRSLLSKVSGDLIPFAGVLSTIRSFFSTSRQHPSPVGSGTCFFYSPHLEARVGRRSEC